MLSDLPSAPFTEAYYRGGTVSNYTDYPAKDFGPLAEDLMAAVPIQTWESVVEVGAATGGLLHAFQSRGLHRVRGMDLSFWAVEEGRKRYGHTRETLQYYSLECVSGVKDWVLFLDVLEHCDDQELHRLLYAATSGTLMHGIIARIPLGAEDGSGYVLPQSRRDVTHQAARPRGWWHSFLGRYGLRYDRPLDTPRIYDSPGVLAAVFRSEHIP